MDRLTARVEWKAAGDDAGSLTGYASTYGNVDRQGDVVEPGAFAASLVEINSVGIPLLADHVASTDKVLGTISAAEGDAHGLRISARFASTPDAQAVRTKAIEGHLGSLSIGYETLLDEWRVDGDGVRVRHILAAKLWEVSVVVFPANPEAVLTGVKGNADAPDLGLELALAEAELNLLRLVVFR